MVQFLISPILSLFSPRMYREARFWRIGKVFGYLAYLTALFAVFIFLVNHFVFMPKVADFLNWFVEATPEMTLTETGLQTDAQQPYLVKHPVLGPFYVIDTTKELDAIVNDPSGALVVVGKTHFIVRSPAEPQPRVFKFSDIWQQYKQKNQEASSIRIDKKLLQTFAQRFQSSIVPIAFLFLIPAFFLWKLIAAVIYFLLSLLLNLIKKEKIAASGLFGISCLALTPASILQGISILIPNIQVNILISVSVTLLYLVLALFVAFRKKENTL